MIYGMTEKEYQQEVQKWYKAWRASEAKQPLLDRICLCANIIDSATGKPAIHQKRLHLEYRALALGRKVAREACKQPARSFVEHFFPKKCSGFRLLVGSQQPRSTA